MSKRYSRLWGNVISTSNLLLAFYQAAKGIAYTCPGAVPGKTSGRFAERPKAAAAAFEINLEENICLLREELGEERYRQGQYAGFCIHDSCSPPP